MDIDAITLIGKNNKLLYKILANNFKPKDLRDIIELNNEVITRFECDMDEQAAYYTKEYNEKKTGHKYL
jgi:hypothetical protein